MKYEAREMPDGEKSKRKKWPLDAEEGKVRKEESVVKNLWKDKKATEKQSREEKTSSEERTEEKKGRLGSGRWK